MDNPTDQKQLIPQLGVRMEARFLKTDPNAKLPTQAHPEFGTGDSGFDLYACIQPSERSSGEGQGNIRIPARGSAVIPIGLKLAYVSPGIWFRIEGRSGLGFKYGIQPHFGIIDNPYRGDLGIKLYNLSDMDYMVTGGDRIAQIIFYPLVQPVLSLTDTVIESNRGELGFGGSGK